VRIYRNCCYCLATDIVVTSEESEGSSKSTNASVKMAGSSRTTSVSIHVEHSLSQIYCRECGRTYIISHRKNELEEISALVENAKNNTGQDDLDQVFNKINREELDFVDFPKYIRGCTKLRNISWKDQLKRYIRKVETYNVFISASDKRYLLVIRKIKGGKVKLSDFYLMGRSDYEF